MAQTDTQTRYWIGPWELLPQLNSLKFGDEITRLEPRYVDLLVYLAKHQGEVVATDDIIDKVWNREFVGDHSVYQAIARLRRALGDNAVSPAFIETVPKRGYRLVCEVRHVPPDQADQPSADDVRPAPAAAGMAALPVRSRKLAWIVTPLILAAFAMLLLLSSRPPQDDRLSVLVLPFSNVSTTRDNEVIAAGFAIEMANRLGQLQELRVLGPQSASLVGNKNLAIDDMQTLLDADMLVTGSLRHAGGKLRAVAVLTDLRTQEQVWSQAFERDDRDVFRMQITVSETLADNLERLGYTPHVRGDNAARTYSDGAYEEYLAARYYRFQRSPKDLWKAAEHFEKAVEAEPDFAGAHVGLAKSYLLLSFYADLPLSEALKKAEPHIKKAEGDQFFAARLSAAVGLSHYLQGNYGAAEEQLRKALDKERNFAEAWMWLGLTLRQQGRLKEALPAFSEATRLEPLMPTAAVNLANALALSGEATTGLMQLRKFAALTPPDTRINRAMSDLYLESGQLTSAYRESEIAMSLAPESQLTRAGHVMILAYMQQIEAAERLAKSILAESPTPSHAVQRYLDRAAVAAPRILGTLIDPSRVVELQDKLATPEIEWRQAHARAGLNAYFAGDNDLTRSHLQRALGGRTYPIERTDYDLFLCTALVDAYRRERNAGESKRWLNQCTQSYRFAVNHGWNTVGLRYMAARLEYCGGHRTSAIAMLAAMQDSGFTNIGLLNADPMFRDLRQHKDFRNLSNRVQHLVDSSWIAVAPTDRKASNDG